MRICRVSRDSLHDSPSRSHEVDDFSRIVRWLAPWVRSDRPILQGSAGVANKVGAPVIDITRVWRGEPIVEIAGVLLLWGFWDVGLLGIQPGSLYRHVDEGRV